MSTREVVICHPVRTPIGTFNGSLKDTPATELGAIAIRETLRRSGLDGAAIDTVVLGNVIQAGNKMNPARPAAIGAGLPVKVPALTVNRVCGSGAQAVVNAAQEILLGYANAAIAGGMESMERAPYLLDGARWGYRMGDAPIRDSMLRDGLVDAFSDQHSGWHTEDLASQLDISRDRQDRWALRSQQRFSTALADGKFDAELVPVEVLQRKARVAFARDETPRPDTTLEALAKLKPAFRPDGTITAGNAPGLNSGAAAMLVADRAWDCTECAAGCIRRRRRRTRHVRARPRAGRQDRAGAGRVDAGRCRAFRNQRSVRGRADRGGGPARHRRGDRQRRRRRDCARPCDRGDGRGADDSPDPFDAARRHQARRRHAVHRRRPGHRAGDRDALSRS